MGCYAGLAACGRGMDLSTSLPARLLATDDDDTCKSSPRERLVELTDLLAAELITPEEFEEKRQAIVRSL